jgi:uncharacterized protein YdiU (UPF0061 family)
MGVGFIHGVMNTDNMTISGETIDYGPCAFLDAYHPGKVFSSIDQYGRYAYANQPQIAVWNLAQLATALLPLMPDRDAAIEEFTEAVNGFADRFDAAWHRVLRAKLGLATQEEGDAALAFDLLERMAKGEADFTNTFRALSGDDPEAAGRSSTIPTRSAHGSAPGARGWRRKGRDEATRVAAMQAVNPALIAAKPPGGGGDFGRTCGDFAPFERLVAVLARPFDPAEATSTSPRRPRQTRR